MTIEAMSRDQLLDEVQRLQRIIDGKDPHPDRHLVIASRREILFQIDQGRDLRRRLGVLQRAVENHLQIGAAGSWGPNPLQAALKESRR